MTLGAFLTVAAVHLAAAMSPGPSFVVSLRTAAAEGFRPAVALAVGYGLGAALWAFAALAGLALLFQLAPALFTTLRVAGAIFLIYLAVQMWRHAREPLPENAGGTPRSAASAVRLGLTTFAANPKTAVFFGAIFAGLIPAGTHWPALALLLAVIFCNETLWYILVARVFSLPRARELYGRAKAWIDRTFGGLLALLGLRIAIG